MKSNLNIKNISEIKSPAFLKDLNYAGLDDLSKLIREKIIDVTSKNGGHLSSNLGVVELTIALHRNFDFSNDKLLFDVGHQAYTHKILTGRDISTLRKKNGVSGFVKCKESKYDIFEAGHSSTSLSAAYAYALDRDIKKEKYDVVAFIGDASIANGVAFEALNNIPNSKHKVIIIINDNEMAISAPVGGLSNIFRNLQTSKSYAMFKKGFKKIFKFLKPIYRLAERFKNWIKRHLIAINIFDALGFVYIGVVDGHDFKALDKAIKKAKKVEGSVVIHVRTIKGKGYKFAENDAIGYWHGVTPFNKETGKPLIAHPHELSWSHLFSDFIYDKLKNDNNFYLICPGTLKGAGLEKAADDFPNRVIDTGISEEHAVIAASNLSKLGYHVAISIYSTFMQRAFDQISHDVARIHAPLVFLVDRCGLVGADGDTHQGIYDSSFLMATPNINVCMARNSSIAKALFNEAFENKEATFIRYPRSLTSKEKIDEHLKLKDFDFIKDNNSSICVIGVGPLLENLKNELKDVKVDIIDPIYLKPIKESLINKLLTYQKIVIYTPYETQTGFAGSLIQQLVLHGFKRDIFIKAVGQEFIEHASIDEQLSKYALTPTMMKDFIKEIL